MSGHEPLIDRTEEGYFFHRGPYYSGRVGPFPTEAEAKRVAAEFVVYYDGDADLWYCRAQGRVVGAFGSEARAVICAAIERGKPRTQKMDRFPSPASQTSPWS
jgi:hypothetical protein